ncbi:membrane fusion protein, multidrug efflux system [Desulfonatronum thiosulfatophilum]|uniref:Membrane fusion protein, multidrug efflux system n=1 Tax=Desulfonatronum thiosulfatophilum TaxID=617002 RepID=A0A1G6D5Q6_9BACT|nr:efflux RND transporter periplasmic adaptor subunit [Desulfonatronum thiosulfatophilum]SDB40420.1 membrane fusion protein, multidrug efflux system [Desulfonatronum thiosulfatophilum]
MYLFMIIKGSSLCRSMLLAVMSMALLGACSNSLGDVPDEPTNLPRKVNVVVQEVSPTELRDVVVLPGTAEPWLSVDLAAETAGRVEKLSVREGDRVTPGQILAQIEVTALAAGRARAQAAFDLFEEQLRRRERLYKDNIISEEELDQVRSGKVQAREELRQAEIEYGRGLVRAPGAGRVNNMRTEVGEFVDRGQGIIELVDIDKIKVQVQVPEMDVRFLNVEQPAAVIVDAFSEQTFSGIVDFIAYRADPATRTFRTQVVVENPDGTIRPGMIARVMFVRQVIPDAVTIPLSAMIDRGGERLVYVEEDGVARARNVSIGVIERDRIQITRGLEPGDRLIVAGHREVEEGTAVVVQ